MSYLHDEEKSDGEMSSYQDEGKSDEWRISYEPGEVWRGEVKLSR